MSQKQNGWVVGYSAVVILSSLLLQIRYARRIELFSEGLCWLAVPLLVRLRVGESEYSKLEDGLDGLSSKYNKSIRWPLWSIAWGLAIVCLCRAEAEVSWILVSENLPQEASFRHHNVNKMHSRLSHRC
jgi:hypothetical protein